MTGDEELTGDLTTQPQDPELAWLEEWLTALLSDPNLEEDEIRLAVALLVLALRRNALTGEGFDLEADKDELAAIAGLPS